eukprot:g30386.t2
MVDLLMGDTQLIDDDHTVMQAGLSEDVALDVLFRVRLIECKTKEDLSCLSGDVEELFAVLEHSRRLPTATALEPTGAP